MGVVEFVHHLQKKPERVRRRLLVFVVAVIMLGIVGLWISVTGRALLATPSATSDSSPSAREQQQRSALTPFEVLAGSVRDAIREFTSYVPKK